MTRNRHTTSFSTLTLCLAVALFISQAAAQENAPGKTGAKIIGGHAASPSELYSTVALLDTELFEETNNASDAQICTGTLIHPRVVVTAAHCVIGFFGDVDPPSLFLVAAYWFDESENGQKDIEIVQVKSARAHSQYIDFLDEDPGVSDPAIHCVDPVGVDPEDCEVFNDPFVYPNNDIALLILKDPITSVSPATIATADYPITKNLAVQASGYGFSQVKDYCDFEYDPEIDVAILKVGDMQIDDFRDAEVAAAPLDTPENSSTTCNGDSGGPLYVTGMSGRRILVGATSRARQDQAVDKQCDCRSGDVYTRVSHYVDWIGKSIGEEHLHVQVQNNEASIVDGDAPAKHKGGRCDFSPASSASFSAGWLSVLTLLAFAGVMRRRRSKISTI